MNFISYIWKRYKISKDISKLKKEMNRLIEETKHLSKQELDKKYKNFARHWALLYGKYLKLKQMKNDL